MASRILILLSVVFISAGSWSQEANYDESGVPFYVLPELLKSADRTLIETSDDWEKIRRPEVLELFRQYVYGRVPEGAYSQSYEVLSQERKALDGVADLYEPDVFFFVIYFHFF